MLRLEWAEDGAFTDEATLAVVHRAQPPVKHGCRIRGNTLTLTTEAFTLRFSDDGMPFSAENLKVSFTLNGETVCWHPGLRDARNLGATLRTLDGIKGDRQHVCTGIERKTKKEKFAWLPVDMGNGFLSRSGWACIDDSPGVLLSGDPQWVAPRPPGERRDWYLLLHGHDYAGALAEAAQVFGRQPLPPRFAFGYWWSRYWAYTDREFEELVRQFDRFTVPIDVLVVDMDWHLEGWTGYSWDRRYFPDPADFLRWVKAQHLKITLNLHPADGVAGFEEQFPAMAAALGVNANKVKRIPFDITDPAYMNAYFTVLHHPQEEAGVDFWWMDWQQGKTTAMPGLDTLPWINHLHWRDMESNPRRHGKRPLIFSRFGGYGAGRYCIGFSGDTYSVWESLHFQPYFTATAANVLYGYWSHDIGGHQPGAIEPELYTRWLQFGVFSPILRTHTTKNADAERRVWEYPSPYSDIMMATIRRRYELVPYIYSEARCCYDSGESLCRPLYHAYPEEDAAYAARDAYFFGSQLLVAPVLAPADPRTELATVEVWLPEGRWFDTARGCFEAGGGTIARGYLLDEVPVFVRPGTLLPGQQAPSRLREGCYKDLVLTAYPGGDGCYRLYEDDGVSDEYREDRCAWIPFLQVQLGDERRITIGAAEGSYVGFLAERTLEVRLPGTVPPRGVCVNGESYAWSYRLGEQGWTYDGDAATTIIRVPRLDLTRDTVISVTANPLLPAELADGLQGLLGPPVRA